ncbi:autotransporter outer membrane beta-barrel domain-containing protein [Prosthecobacter vanneervenii]|uniref:Autotransporter domain-containing protein n=1 Tax=Prosthecobacter vanneervenii TaxID=48466 RepID=A0A7W7YDM1_9BACT|nr:autotransporter outer membrane beta-barrel domain-containing protein [Prosthecobacter vanneervenii]MBB5034214.1 hypothetical protein [Prosthecobacter vanneervenii]
MKPAYAVDATYGNIMNGGAGVNYTYDGGGAIINGNGSNGFFLQSGNLNLSNVTLQNFAVKGGDGSGGGAGMGGALFINSGTNVELNNVNFLSNNAAGGNGGVGTTGGTLNNLFSNTTKAANGSDGREFLDTFLGVRIFMNDGNGGNGFHASNGANGAPQVAGGNGGNGGNGGDGWDIDPINTALAAFYTARAVIEALGASNPVTEPAGATKSGAEAASSSAQAVTYGLQAAAYIAMNQAGYVGFGGDGGNGGVGGNGGDFNGGGRGGDGGNGGNGAGGASGGGGGDGGPGGIGGFGAGGGRGGNGGAGGAPGSSFAGLAGGGGQGGAGPGGMGGFGGGMGATGLDNLTPQGGGEGGNGFGGAIFIRTGGSLTITGNTLFDGNGIRSGNGQPRSSGATIGQSGIGGGSDLFLMKGATLILDADKYSTGNVITFNGNPYGTGISDDAAASIIPSGGPTDTPSGSGADVVIRSGLVQFVGANLYSGQTRIEGGTLQANDSEGIYWDSNINFAGSLTSNAVLMSDGTVADFTRYVGAQSNRVQWTGSGGFAAVGGDLTVNLSNNQTLKWGENGFVSSGNALVFGADQATNNVIFQNNMDLKGGNATVLSTTSSAASGTNADGTPAGSTVYLSGKISDTTGGASFNINDTNHDGTVVLQGASTYTGITNINNGRVDLTGSLASNTVNVSATSTLNSTNGGLASVSTVTNAGTLNLGSVNDTITTLNNSGNIKGTATLTATTYNLNDGSILDAKLGTGTIVVNGNVTLNQSAEASLVTVNSGGTLNLGGADLLSHTASVNVNGVLNLNGGGATFQTLSGSGTIHTNGYALVVADGGNFTGTLDAPGSSLSTGGGTGGGGGGGGLTLGGGTTTTQSTNVDSGLTIGSGATLNSGTITISNGSTLDLSSGGTITFTTLTTPSGSAPGIINIGSHDFIVPVGSTISGDIKFVGTGNVIILGTIAPGHSPGVIDLTLAGLSPSLGGAFKAELAGTGGVGGTDFDQVQLATGATLTISNALNVANYSGFMPKQGESFQIISGPAGAVPINHLTGTFSTVTYDADGIAGPGAPVVNAAMVFDVNTGKMTATGLNDANSTISQLGNNSNQSAAAAAIFNAAWVGQNQIDSSTTAGRLALQITDAAGSASGDLARYTPEYYGSLSDYAFMGNQVLVRSVQDRVSPMSYVPSQLDEDRLSQVPEVMSFFTGYTYANLNTADAAKGTRNDYYAGVNLLASEDYVFGIAGSGSSGSIKAALGSAKSDGWGLMAFGRYVVAKSFTFFGSFGFNEQTMDTTRQTVNGTVKGGTDVSSYVGFLGVQYKGWRVGGVSIAPRVSLSYSHTSVGGFSETGAVDALNVSGYHDNRFVAEAGASALWSTDIGGHGLNVELAASVQQYLVNTKSQMGLSVATVPTANYGMNFAKVGSTQAVLQLNAGYDITKVLTGYLGYEGHYGSQTTQYAKAGIRANF